MIDDEMTNDGCDLMDDVYDLMNALFFDSPLSNQPNYYYNQLIIKTFDKK